MSGAVSYPPSHTPSGTLGAAQDDRKDLIGIFSFRAGRIAALKKPC
jgi:hypothetical protein